jgi:hypothetical protein
MYADAASLAPLCVNDMFFKFRFGHMDSLIERLFNATPWPRMIKPETRIPDSSYRRRIELNINSG